MSEGVSDSVRPMLEKIRAMTPKPLMVGFGISTPAHAAMLSRWSDGIVIGSAIVRIVEESSAGGDTCGAIKSFTRGIKDALQNNKQLPQP